MDTLLIITVGVIATEILLGTIIIIIQMSIQLPMILIVIGSEDRHAYNICN